MTVWPLPSAPLPSLTHTLPSQSTKRPCGKLNMPAPKLVTSLPDESNFWIGATFEPVQVLEPQRSNTHTLLPSRSMSMLIAWPHTRPSGSCAQFSTARYGFGALLTSWAPPPTGELAPDATIATPSKAVTRHCMTRPPWGCAFALVLGGLEAKTSMRLS